MRLIILDLFSALRRNLSFPMKVVSEMNFTIGSSFELTPHLTLTEDIEALYPSDTTDNLAYFLYVKSA